MVESRASESDPSPGRLFGRNLRRERGRLGISQEELGFRAGLHRNQIGQIERGERSPRLHTIVKLAGGLGVSPCELLKGMGWTRSRFQLGDFEIDRDQADVPARGGHSDVVVEGRRSKEQKTTTRVLGTGATKT